MQYFLLFIATASLLSAATGDILSVAVQSDGWTADITIEGKTTGGTYDMGLGLMPQHPDIPNLQPTPVHK